MSKSTSKGRTPFSATDNKSYHTLFEEYEGELYRYVRYLCTSSTQAEDIYQETWLRAAQHIAKNRVHSCSRPGLQDPGNQQDNELRERHG